MACHLTCFYHVFWDKNWGARFASKLQYPRQLKRRIVGQGSDTYLPKRCLLKHERAGAKLLHKLRPSALRFERYKWLKTEYTIAQSCGHKWLWRLYKVDDNNVCDTCRKFGGCAAMLSKRDGGQFNTLVLSLTELSLSLKIKVRLGKRALAYNLVWFFISSLNFSQAADPVFKAVYLHYKNSHCKTLE